MDTRWQNQELANKSEIENSGNKRCAKISEYTVHEILIADSMILCIR